MSRMRRQRLRLRHGRCGGVLILACLGVATARAGTLLPCTDTGLGTGGCISTVATASPAPSVQPVTTLLPQPLGTGAGTGGGLLQPVASPIASAVASVTSTVNSTVAGLSGLPTSQPSLPASPLPSVLPTSAPVNATPVPNRATASTPASTTQTAASSHSSGVVTGSGAVIAPIASRTGVASGTTTGPLTSASPGAGSGAVAAPSPGLSYAQPILAGLPLGPLSGIDLSHTSGLELLVSALDLALAVMVGTVAWRSRHRSLDG